MQIGLACKFWESFLQQKMTMFVTTAASDPPITTQHTNIYVIVEQPVQTLLALGCLTQQDCFTDTP